MSKTEQDVRVVKKSDGLKRSGEGKDLETI
jgi:hypothetical protein